MKILRVADVPDNRTGGMSRINYGTGDIMRRLGHDVSYLFTEQISQLGSGWGRLRRFVVPCRIAQHIVRQQRSNAPYDVVEIHEPSAAAYAARRLVDKSLPPLVIISHGIEARGRLAKIRYLENKGLPVSLRQRYSALSVVWPANFALRNADHVLCTNVEDASFVSAMRGRPDEVTFLPNGVDAAFLSNGADRPWDSSLARRLLFLGTWYDRKGIAELATAATRVLDEFSDGHLTVAGCFHSQAVVHACFPNHLHARIEVIPRITDNATLVDVYRRNGIFVLPSYFEGQPLVMLEAAAMGLPIVSTNICGMRDFVEPGRHGWLVPPGDAEALTSAIRRLMASPDEVRTQGNAVRAKVQIYTWENSAVATLAAYERACISASRRARVSEDAVRSNHAAEAKVIGGNTR